MRPLLTVGVAPPAPICDPTEATAGSRRTAFDQRLLALRHGRVGNVLRRFGDADDHAGVLLRKEPLGDDHIEISGEPMVPSIAMSVMKRCRSTILSAAS